MYLRYCKKISRSYTLNLSEEIDFENRPFFQKEKIIIQKYQTDMNEILKCVVIIGGICVSEINNLADKF